MMVGKFPGARLKRMCAGCNKRMNLAFDPQGKLCADCLIEWRDETVQRHKNGKISFQDAHEMITERCRMSDYDALELIFPPLGEQDFHSDRMAMKLNFDIDDIKLQEAIERRLHEDE